MAHVQYDFYNNVFAFLCRSLPSARPLSRAGGLGLGGAGSGDHLLVGGPSAALAAASATSVCSAPAALLWPQTQTPRTQVSALSVGVEVGGSVALPAVSLALVVTLCLLSLLWQILIKMQNRV